MRGPGSGWRGISKITVGYWTDSWSEDEISFWLNYTVGQDNEKMEVSQKILLKSTIPNFGGSRWWFVCQMEGIGWLCNRRMVTLHLPSREIFFGCRFSIILPTPVARITTSLSLYAHMAREAGFTPEEVKKAMMERF